MPLQADGTSDEDGAMSGEMEVPPSELARLKWVQPRAAYTAGASAWQNGSRASVTSAS